MAHLLAGGYDAAVSETQALTKPALPQTSLSAPSVHLTR